MRIRIPCFATYFVLCGTPDTPAGIRCIESWRSLWCGQSPRGDAKNCGNLNLRPWLLCGWRVWNARPTFVYIIDNRAGFHDGRVLAGINHQLRD